MTITLTGATFQYRETLKAFRGRWDNASKSWKFDYLTSEQITTLRGLAGCTLTDDAPPRAEPVRDSERPLCETQTYGDCDRFINHFANQKPLVHFGFSSLDGFLDYIEALPEQRREPRSRPWLISADRTDFTGTGSMQEALALARDGWREGLEALPSLDLPHALQRRRTPSVAGGTVSVGRMLSGVPAHMVRRSPQPGRKVVTLFVNVANGADIAAENMIIRARLVAAICDELERKSYACEIVAVHIAKNYGHSYQVTTKIKNAGERLNLLNTIFTLGHPSMFRRLSNACFAGSDRCAPLCGSGYGTPVDAFNKEWRCAPNEFYIGRLTANAQAKLTDDPLSMLPFIKPEGLEL